MAPEEEGDRKLSESREEQDRPDSTPPSTSISTLSLLKVQEGEDTVEGDRSIVVRKEDISREDDEDDDDDNGDLNSSKPDEVARTGEQLAATRRLPLPEALKGSHTHSSLSTGQGTVALRPAQRHNIHTIATTRGRLAHSCALCSTQRNFCRIISGLFTRSPLPYGYSLVTPVPAGVCNLTITEMKPSKNFFALRQSDGSYVLNGNWDIQAAGRYEVAGTIFLYTPGSEGHGEQLSAPGPLTQPIDFMVISQSPNPGIKYEYRVPLPEYLGNNQPGVSLPSSGLLPATGDLGSSFGGVIPNIGGTGSSTVGHSRGSGRPAGGHSTPFQPIPPRHTNVGTRNPSFDLRNPSTSRVSTGGSGLYPNLLPLTPVLQPVSIAGQTTTFNSSATSSSSSLNSQGSVGTNLSGPSRRNPSFTRIPLLPAPDHGSHSTLGVPRVPPHSSATTSLVNPGSTSHSLPWNPKYPSQDKSQNGVPSLGTHLLTGQQQYPGVSGMATTPTGTGFQDSSYVGQGRTTGETSNSPAADSRRPSSTTPGHSSQHHHHHSLPKPTTSSDNTAHRTRHQHGSEGHRKLTDISSEVSSEVPGVQLTQPKSTPLAPSGRRTSSGGVPRRRGKKGSRRRHRHQQDRGTEDSKGRRKTKGHHSRFQWAEKGLTPCSRTCGGGNQTAILSCERKRKKKVVPDRRCSHLDPPQPRTVLCNLSPCPATWMADDWEACSVTCGLGVQTRRLMCKQVVSPTLTMGVPEAACLLPPDIPTSQVCDKRPCNVGPVWEAGPWTNCSAPCGLGTRTRRVSCMVDGIAVDQNSCQASTQPAAEEVCDMGSCATNVWFFSNWSSQCTEQCGTGVQTRMVHCLGGESSCPSSSRPDATKPCLGENGCGGQWFTGAWSTCSAECGGGEERRGVVCVVWSRGRWRVAQDSRCQAHNRPQDTRRCNLQPCTPLWFTSQWSQCSVSCEGGVMRREVTCLDTSLHPSPDCLNSTRPTSHQPCSFHTCIAHHTSTTPSSVSPTLLPTGQTEGAILGNASAFPTHFTLAGDRAKKEADYVEEDKREEKEKDQENEEEREVKMEEGLREKNTMEKVEGDRSTGEVEKASDVEEERDTVVVQTDSESAERLDIEAEMTREVKETTVRPLNVVIPDQEAQGDESVSTRDDSEGEDGKVDVEDEEMEEKRKKKKKRNRQRLRESQNSCIDRIKNCHLVFRARLCRLRYYNKLCCRTCTTTTTTTTITTT
ncbi:hypothetical protein Pcinc_034783 [Petrolisthes cinctipes]|uniref:PLAC domain-containing protein n=1 Tax=Petrolisthes cinctipes TaxID=88211 RepID=A0AAE1C1R2_PETCI|nr:hypothetical protein Pcinc_034783 [Petrolisthes cinctipes]